MTVYLCIAIEGREDFIWDIVMPAPLIEMTADDNVTFSLTLTEHDADEKNMPRILIEDDEISFHEVLLEETSEAVYQRKYETITKRYFKEAFGSASLTVHFKAKEYVLWFEILARRIQAIYAEEMLKYLSEKSEHIIRVCLSHTAHPIQQHDHETITPEILLSTVESFVNAVLSVRLELKHQLKKRLVPIKKPIWEASHFDMGIDPYDVLLNLDKLQPTIGEGDIHIKGKHFMISGVSISTLEATPDIEENAVILGGIYSMRRKIMDLEKEIQVFCKDKKMVPYDEDYVTLSEMLLRLTVGELLERCAALIVTLEELIAYFERTLRIVFRGEIRPHMTAHIRSSKLYRLLFEHLKNWYSLGAPSLNHRDFLTKLRSLSKIYEYFTLFKLFDYFESHEWSLNNVVFENNEHKIIPQSFEFSKVGVSIMIEYEKKILPLSKQSNHLDLIDLKHSNASGIYWWPDFLMTIKKNEEVIYAVLDAKYSSPMNIKEIHLPSLFEKYFLEMAVFDQQKNLLNGDRILGIFAIFPGWNPDQNIINWRGHRHGFLTGAVPRLPVVAAVPLSVHSDDLITTSLTRIIELSEGRLNYFSLKRE